jgi:hypothetical protein
MASDEQQGVVADSPTLLPSSEFMNRTLNIA